MFIKKQPVFNDIHLFSHIGVSLDCEKNVH